MSTPLSDLGSFYAERIARASARAAEERRLQAERAREPKTLDQLVSEKVQEIDTLDKVAQQLGQALGRAIKRNVDSPYAVEVVADLARDWYVVTVTRRGWFSGLGAKTETVILPGEALVLHTGSKETFRYWTKRVGPLLRALFEGRDRFMTGGWYEASGAGVTVAAEEKAEVVEDLAELGFLQEEDAVRAEEVQWAIETLMRSLGARSDASPSPDSP